IIEDGRIDAFVKERYSSFESELGRKIREGKATLEELAEYSEKAVSVTVPDSGRQEYLLSVINQLMLKG
ncbi:MAG TPA: xylose isomerase, partial [Clostridiales bacterium]|nr:xylose isomerase [Clostridiales bacterium]